MKWLALLLLIAAVTVGVMYWRKQNVAGPSSPSPSAAAAAPAVSAPAAPATASSGDVGLEYKGYIIPARRILISPKVSGMIERLNIVEGQRVKENEVLAELEKIDYLADLRRAEAMLAASRQRLAELQRGFRPEEKQQAEAELAEATALLAQNTADYKRSNELRAKNVISKEELDAVESRYQSTVHRVARLTFAVDLVRQGPRVERIEVAKAEVNQFEAELAKSRWRLDNTLIRAPIAGTILKKNAEIGNLVNPIAFNGSFSICEMADLSDLEVELTIQERDIARVFVNQQCRVRTDAFPERIYQGVVSRLMPIADRAKGAIPVRVKVRVPPDEEGVYLKPEMGAIVTLLAAGASK